MKRFLIFAMLATCVCIASKFDDRVAYFLDDTQTDYTGTKFEARDENNEPRELTAEEAELLQLDSEALKGDYNE